MMKPFLSFVYVRGIHRDAKLLSSGMALVLIYFLMPLLSTIAHAHHVHVAVPGLHNDVDCMYRRPPNGGYVESVQSSSTALTIRIDVRQTGVRRL